ncbi:MAG: hypothetical protein K5790_10390 [Nitrosopumilus sp.]|uniref:hypothetical protein n=1 Tax=Nitrosopumilus sp. TaxID=2024843 RepID=UPI00247C2B2F|nr:hypothetical protein [Nitrosopumilus sp.]MCV0393678.1 hypothetical protein [Nitrosopumilus sp.]
MKKSVKNTSDEKLNNKLLSLLKKPNRTIFAIVDDIGTDIEVGYYDYSRLEGNRACIRKQGYDLHRYNKFEEKELMKLEKKSTDKFVAFWDFIEDDDPKWCFVSGYYIPPRLRGTEAVQPFKNGEWCYKDRYDRYLKWNVVSDKLTEDSDLICIATKPKKPRDFTIRPFVKNTEYEIRKHIRANPHGFDEDDRCENIGNWKAIRAKYFLKPNGSRFPRVR